jgi:membrane-anchored mycosin MYCP
VRFLPRIPLYSAAVAIATAGTVLLATTPVQAQQEGWDLKMANEEDRVACVPVSEGGSSLNQRPWAKNFIGLEEAQQYNRGTFTTGPKDGQPVTIAVIDSGVAGQRSDVFGSRLLEGYDWWDENAKGQCDSNDHGTAVAAIAAGGAVGSDDFIGVAPEANILPIRVFDSKKEGGDDTKSKVVAGAITDAVRHGADVINISLALVPTSELETAVANAIASGTVIVAATGNENKHMDDRSIEVEQQTFYPANYPGVIAVGAHNPTGNWYAQTNFGQNIDLLAPGQDVAFPHASGDWLSSSGTSFAAPFVSGAAALLKGEYGADATPAWIQRRLQETAIHPPNTFNIYQGHGVLNVAAALTAPYDPDEVTSDTVEEVPTEDTSSPQPVVDDDRPSIAGLDPDYDPLGFEKAVAWSSVGGSIVLIALVLVLRNIIPKGRKRGWRPGTRKPENLPVKAPTEA